MVDQTRLVEALQQVMSDDSDDDNAMITDVMNAAKIVVEQLDMSDILRDIAQTYAAQFAEQAQAQGIHPLQFGARCAKLALDSMICTSIATGFVVAHKEFTSMQQEGTAWLDSLEVCDEPNIDGTSGE